MHCAHVMKGFRLLSAKHASTRSWAVVQVDNDATMRLLTYRWYPTAINNWDGRLLIASGWDLDDGTGCENILVAHLSLSVLRSMCKCGK